MGFDEDLEVNFRGEFVPIRNLSPEEVEKDRLVKRIKLQKKVARLEATDQNGRNNLQNTEKEVDEEEAKPPENAKIDSRARREKFKNFELINTSEGRVTSNSQKESGAVDANEVAIDTQKLKMPAGEAGTKDEIRKAKLKDFKLTDAGDNLLIEPLRLQQLRSRKINEECALIEESVKGSIDEEDIVKIKRRVMQQLTGRYDNFPNIMLSSLRERCEEVYQILEHTVRDREGNSAFILGPRATGKTSIIEHSLAKLETTYPDQFITVKLNAHLHNNDNTALRDIARQLDYNTKKLRNNEEVSTEKFEQRSIGDTVSNVLSTLDRRTNGVSNSHEQSLALIFIIDEFEQFTEGKQTLLYNLFDLSQISATPICIIGVTTKITAREHLEKRVRSRFSQRIITINKARSLEEFWTNARLGLVLDDQQINNLKNPQYGFCWNKYIDAIFSDVSSQLRKFIIRIFYTTKNYKEFNNHCINCIFKISEEHPFPFDEDFSQYSNGQSFNNIQAMLDSLSDLELILLICAARWIEKFEILMVNFNLAYREYQDTMKSVNSASASSLTSSTDMNVSSQIRVQQKVFSAEILKTSWEVLYKLGLLLDYGAITTNNAGQIISTTNRNRNILLEDNKMVHLNITLDELHYLLDDRNAYKSLTKLSI